MSGEYKVAYQGGEGEIIEKKSRFIGTVRPVESEQEAVAFIEEMKKKYWNATHNCSAFVTGRNHQIQRCSDDGEPSGTAGKPMLDVLLGADIHNTAIVVTRYFGGTLLGTGGLVKAYTKAAQAGLESSVIITKTAGERIKIVTDYQGIGKIQYILAQNNIFTIKTDYGEHVEVEAAVAVHLTSRLHKEITEATSGQAGISKLDDIYFAKLGDEVLLFEE